MTRIYRCLKCVFISFNVFMIMGGLIGVVCLAQLSPSLDAMQGGSDLEVQSTNHIILYIAGFVTMVIAILGVCAACTENLVALSVFLVCSIIGSLLMLGAGVSAAITWPKLESLMKERWRSFLPLDQTSDDIKNQAEALQTSLHCCGLFSYEDWEQNIPISCLCDQEVEGECQAVDYNNFLLNLLWQKKSVFRQTCFPLLMDFVKTNATITLGSTFTLFVLALFSSVLSALMICQMSNTSASPNALLWSVLVMVDQPPAYEHLYDHSE